MAQRNTDIRIGSKIDPSLRREDAAGIRYDSGPYIGKIKNNIDPTRSGRLQVWIPDLGASDENNPNNWRTVFYASPFWGSTVQDPSGPEHNQTGTDKNSYSNVKHTYGLWYTVPDLENFVLCTFVSGDPTRGFWFACVPNQFGHHMIPGIASSSDIDYDNIEDATLKTLVTKKLTGQPLPVVEINEYKADNDWANFVNTKKPLHETQTKKLIQQGLDRINLTGARGAVFSTSQRETPSSVFGITSPGRIYKTDLGPNEQLRVKARKGGHQFIMDDGNTNGLNNLVRLRTSGGHQILMDDTDRILYIGNSEGSAWVELTGTGHINVYAANSINLRAAGDFNFHADRDVNINAGGNFNLSASGQAIIKSNQSLKLISDADLSIYGNGIGIGADGRIDIDANGSGSFSAGQSLMLTGKPIGLNSGSGAPVNKPNASAVYNLTDTKFKDGLWEIERNAIKSVAKIVPTHEPWLRVPGSVSSASSGGSAGAGGSTGASRGVTVPSNTLNTDASQATTFNSNNSIATGAAPVVSGADLSCGQNYTLQSSGGVVRDSSGNPVLTGAAQDLDPGPRAALLETVKNPVPKSLFNSDRAVNPSGGIGPLSILQVKAIMVQMGYSESGGVYSKINTIGFVGKYQFGAAALTDMLYIKRDAYNQYKNNSTLNYQASWTGKNGVNSLTDWFSNPGAQESAMYELLRYNFTIMLGNGGIKKDDDVCTVAGMLCCAQLLGATGAKNWRKSGAGADAYGSTGAKYFNLGRYAVDVLANGA